MKPTVVIAEDDFLILEGTLRPVVSAEFEIVATVEDGMAAVDAAGKHRPDVVLLDISLPRMRGFAAARQILAAQPECRVLFVSNYWDASYIRAAMELGAGGYVFKSRIPAEITDAIRTALSGGFYQSVR